MVFKQEPTKEELMEVLREAYEVLTAQESVIHLAPTPVSIYKIRYRVVPYWEHHKLVERIDKLFE